LFYSHYINSFPITGYKSLGGRQVTFKGLLFDKDGTLFHFQESWGEWMSQIINDLTAGSTRDRKMMAKVLGFDLIQKTFHKDSVFIAGVAGEFLSIIEPYSCRLKGDALREFITSKSVKLIQVPVTNLPKLFAQLKSQNILLGIVTNDCEEPAKSQLESAKILDYFDFVVGCDSGYGAKPETGQLLEFLNIFDLKSHEVAMIGDSTHDLKAAQKAKIYSVGVLTGVAEEKELMPYADKILDSIESIPSWLR